MALLILFTGLFIAIMTIGWYIHISMNKEERGHYGYASFMCFLKEYKKRTWFRDAEYRRSHFCESHDDGYIHASIIRFGGKQMIMTYWSYYPYSFWILLNRYNGSDGRFNRNTVKWCCEEDTTQEPTPTTKP